MRVKKRLLWYFGSHLPQHAVIPLTAKSKRLLWQTTDTELAGKHREGLPKHAQTHTHTHTHTQHLHSHSSPSQQSQPDPPPAPRHYQRGRDRVSVCRGEGGCRKPSERQSEGEWFKLPSPGRGKLEGPGVEVGVEQEWGSEWWRGRGVRGKGRRAIQLRQQTPRRHSANVKVLSELCVELQTHTEAYSRFEVKNSRVQKNTLLARLPAQSKHWTKHTHTQIHARTQSLRSGVPSRPLPTRGKLLSLPSSPLESCTTSCQLRQTDRTRHTVAQTARKALHCALITRPAEMPFDPETQAVWPAVDWWEWHSWPTMTFPHSLLTKSCPWVHLVCLCVFVSVCVCVCVCVCISRAPDKLFSPPTHNRSQKNNH